MDLVRNSVLWLLLLGGVTGCARHKDAGVDVDVGGHRLHLLVLGETHHAPAVIFESGGPGQIGWSHVRDQIAQGSEVVTYDRAGNGLSAPGPEPRDAGTIARDLHTALHRAGIAPPYVLGGQSIGGIYVQVFANLFPDETAGLVLVDPTPASPELCSSVDEVKAWFMSHDPDDWPRVQEACRGTPEGLQSFLACKYQVMEEFIETVPEPRRSAMRSDWWTMVNKVLAASPPWQFTGGAGQELKVMADSIRHAVAARPVPKVPIILLASGKTDLDTVPADATTPNTPTLQAEALRWKLAAFQQWIDATPGSKLVIVPGSGHNIESQCPQAVIDAVHEVILECGRTK